MEKHFLSSLFSIYFQPLLTTKYQQHTNTITTVSNTSTTIITAQTGVVLETNKTQQTLRTSITRFTIAKEQAIVHYLVEVQNNYPTILKMVEETAIMPSDHP